MSICNLTYFFTFKLCFFWNPLYLLLIQADYSCYKPFRAHLEPTSAFSGVLLEAGLSFSFYVHLPTGRGQGQQGSKVQGVLLTKSARFLGAERWGTL